jgi:ribosomal protein S27AE
MSDLVYWSVAECNRMHGRTVKTRGELCPYCGADAWICRWGVNPDYRSEYNPGEYIQYTCTKCGYVGEELPS